MSKGSAASAHFSFTCQTVVKILCTYHTTIHKVIKTILPNNAVLLTCFKITGVYVVTWLSVLFMSLPVCSLAASAAIHHLNLSQTWTAWEALNGAATTCFGSCVVCKIFGIIIINIDTITEVVLQAAVRVTIDAAKGISFVTGLLKVGFPP